METEDVSRKENKPSKNAYRAQEKKQEDAGVPEGQRGAVHC